MRRTILALLAVGWAAWAQPTPSFTVTVAGEKTWTITLGFGATELLSGEGLAPGQPALTQTLRAEIEGTALGFVTVRASFNDQLGPGFQDFLVTAAQGPWKGELGRFTVGAEGEGLGVYNKRVLGARVSFAGETVQAGALVTRLEGISESRTFRGERGFAEMEFAREDPDRPWEPAPYLRSVEGLAYWPLRLPFVEGLTQVTLRLDKTGALGTFLADWGLDYLLPDLAADAAVASGEYLVLRDNGDALALRLSPASLARRVVQEAIEAHNRRLGLAGGSRRTYPFVGGSELEGRFLTGLTAYLAVAVDEDRYPFGDLRRRRYLLLGEKDVIEGSVEVSLRLPGETEFRPSSELPEYRWSLLPGPGVLVIAFPDSFFSGGAVRLSYAYRREGATFSLGLSVVPGSERVYLDNRPLVRGSDYSLDYESGLLLLFTPLGEEDTLRVDFERQRGGLGGATEYERNLFGLSLTFPDLDGLRLGIWRAMDFGTPGPTTRTMPNAHTVAALSAAGQVGEWRYSLSLGGSENVFPADDNARIPTANRIHAIAAFSAPDGTYVVFAHGNGLTAYKDGAFSSYSSAHGLGGRAAYALLPLPGQLLVGTDSGLTVVRLADPSPLDRIRSWVRLGSSDGVPGARVVALAEGEGRVYLATEKSLAAFAPAAAERPASWEKIAIPEGALEPTALLAAGEALYLGTENGLFVRQGGLWTRVVEVGGRVHALALRGEEVLVGTEEGIRILRGGTGAGWVVLGRPVYGMVVHDGVLWYAAGDGLWREGEAGPTLRGRVVAVGAGGGAVWAGEEADEAFSLPLWRVGETVERFPQTRTKIDGRDLAQFRDIPASEHTRYGLTGNLRLQRSAGGWDLDLRVASRLPGYEEIGRAGRSDAHGISLSARTVQGQASVDLRGSWTVTDLAVRPTGKLSAGLDWRRTGSPSLSLSLNPEFLGDGLVPRTGLNLGWRGGASDKGPTWFWSLTGSGSLRTPGLSASGQLGASGSLQLAPGWTLSGSWARPFQSERARGEETISATLTGTGTVQGASWSIAGTETLRHRLETGRWTAEHALLGELRPRPLTVSGTQLAPQLSGSWSLTPSDWRWSGRLAADLSRSPVLFRLSLNLGGAFQPATERGERTLGYSVTWEYGGLLGLRPTVRWDRSWTTLSHPRYGERTTEKEELSLRLAAEAPDRGWRDSLSVVWKPGEGRLSLTNRFSLAREAWTLTADTTATAEGETVEVKTMAQVGVPLDTVLQALGGRSVGDAWTVNLALGHALKARPEAGLQGALWLGVTLAVRF